MPDLNLKLLIPPPRKGRKRGWLGNLYWLVLIWAVTMAACLVCAACSTPEKHP